MTEHSKLYKTMKTPDSILRSAVVIALAAAFLLLVPLIAMQFDTGVNWSFSDFAVAWILLFGAGFTYKLVVRKIGGSNAYRLAAGTAVATALLLVWANLAVGLIGDENNPANLMYLGVLAVGVIGALIIRFQPHRMEYVLGATALAQMLVALIALLAGTRLMQESSVFEVFCVNGFFAALWTGSALLFRYAGRKQTLAS